MFFLTNTVKHFQALPVTFTKYVNKHNISQIKLFWGKMGAVYVTYVADVDKGQ